MPDPVALTDLETIQRWSLAVRTATADRAELVAALRSDLAWLEGARSRAAAPAPAAKAAAKAPARTAAKAPARSAAKAPARTAAKAPARTAGKRAGSTKASRR